MYKAFIHSMLLIAAANAQYVSTRTVTALVCPQRSFTTIQTSSTSTTIRTPLSTFTTSATSSQGVGIPVWNEGPPVPQSVTTRSTTTTTTTTSRATVGVPAFNSQPPAAPSSQDIPKPLLRTNTTTTPYTTVTYTVVPFQTLVANNTTFTPISSPTNGILNPPTDIATAPSSTSVGLQNGGDTPVSPTSTNPSNGASVFVGEAPSKCVWDVMSSLVVMIAVWFAVM